MMADDDRDLASEDEFRRAMEGVSKLPEPRATTGRRRTPRKRREPLEPPEKKYTFDVDVYGEQVEGLVSGGDWKQLRSLRRGEIPPEAEFDLHGLHESEARRRVQRVVREAFESGLRSVLIIHGRGQHSANRAVLKEAVPNWLVEPTIAGVVLAFCTAPIELGAGGAVLVLLRRNKAAE